MIPKKIHYCWFGGNPKPKLAEKCFRSWKRYCPGYEIVEWNEDNYDLSAAPLYVRQAYEAKKWAFVTDYVRLQVVYEQGGIYLDTDVELRKPLAQLLENRAWFGFEDGKHVNTGCGFGAEQGHRILRDMMDDYRDIPFVQADGTFDTLSCPRRNTAVFLCQGLRQDNSMQTLEDGVLVLPSDYLNPKDWKTGEIRITENTISVHHFSASWYSPDEQKKLRKQHRDEWLRHLPSTIGWKILGKERYERLRSILKH